MPASSWHRIAIVAGMSLAMAALHPSAGRAAGPQAAPAEDASKASGRPSRSASVQSPAAEHPRAAGAGQSPRPEPSWEARERSEPSPPPEPGERGSVRLHLVYQTRLDRNPRAGEPDEHSKISVAPADVVASGVIPPIVLTTTEAVFVHPDGTIANRVPLLNNDKYDTHTSLSPHGKMLLIEQADRPGPDENQEPPDGHVAYSVYNSEGRLLYSRDGDDGEELFISDGGVLVSTSPYGTKPTFQLPADPSTIHTLPFKPEGDARAAATPSGDRILISYLAGGGMGVKLFTSLGNVLWTRTVPGPDFLKEQGLSDDGHFALITGYDSKDPILASVEMLLGPEGQVVQSDTKGDFLVAQDRVKYLPEANAFELGEACRFPSIFLITTAGVTTRVVIPTPVDRPAMLGLAATVGSGVDAWLGCADNELSLLLSRLDGSRLLLQPIPHVVTEHRVHEESEGDQSAARDEGDENKPCAVASSQVKLRLAADDHFLWLQLNREIRVYEILGNQARGGEK